MQEATDKPVFIDQMPDYKEAMQKIAALSAHPAAFGAVVDELGLGAEWQKTKTSIDGARKQALDSKGKIIADRAADMAARSQRATTIVSDVHHTAMIAGGLAGGYISAAKGWGLLKGLVFTAVAAVATAFTATFIAKRIIPDPNIAAGAGLEKDAELSKERNQQLAAQVDNMQKGFAATMATRMLEQQKTLSGEEENMKLTSTAAIPKMVPGALATKILEEKAVAQHRVNAR